MARTRLEYSLKGLPLRKLPASALRACVQEGISSAQLRKDIIAGILVGVVSIPLAMALSIAVGLPPQHGLYTAIIAGMIAPILGGSRLNIVGPTAAFVVILGPIIHQFGLPGLLISCSMAGLILIGMAGLRMGSLIEYIPFPVTTGFTSGIALVIGCLQLKDALGIKGISVASHFPEKMHEIWQARNTFSWGEMAVTFFTLIVLLLPRYPKTVLARIPAFIVRIPAPLLALPTAALFVYILERLVPGLDIVTLGERFSYQVNGLQVQGIPRTLPGFAWPWVHDPSSSTAFEFTWGTIRSLLPSAVTIAFLGAIESLLSAVVADGMARTRHEPDSELFALGVANFITPFFGGIPATGALARTASNYRFGGRTPISAMVHSLTVLMAVVVLAPLLSYLPMAGMAALLLLVAWNMSEIEHFIYTVRVAPKSDSAVLIICFLLTVFFDMVIAVSVGVLLGALFFIRRMAFMTEGGFIDKAQTTSLEIEIPKEVVLYSINGPLFFGAAERAIGSLRTLGKEIKVVVFLLEDVMVADMTGLVAMEGVISELKYHGIKAILVGTQPKVKELFVKGGLKPMLGVIDYADDIQKALQMVGASWEKYQRRQDIGPIRIRPLHRQRASEAAAESSDNDLS